MNNLIFPGKWIYLLRSTSRNSINMEANSITRLISSVQLQVPTNHYFISPLLFYNSVTTSIKQCTEAIHKIMHSIHKQKGYSFFSVKKYYTRRTALMQPSFSGLFVTWAYLPGIQPSTKKMNDQNSKDKRIPEV